jgi:predicted secreted hydrolase
MNKRWLVATALIAACGSDPQVPPALSVSAMLGGDSTAGYARATRPRRFEFPRDHGAHPRYKHEWWYFTGNLIAGDGRRYGYQFTLFRHAVAPQPPTTVSRWSTNQLYLAHVALADISAGSFRYDERFSRGGLGLAGVTAQPFRAWLEDWQIDELPSQQQCGQCFRVRILASARTFALDLSLQNSKPPGLHGNNGLSAKSRTAGNASYYYSHTRLDTRGTIRQGGNSSTVRGSSWFDHEWSTSALEQEQSGWDWFAIQLEDATEIMLYRLRHRGDSSLDYLYGSYIDAEGSLTPLDEDEFAIRVDGRWRSPRSGTVYPAAWRINLPQRGITLTVRPRLADQEMLTSFRYWEGAVEISGKRHGTAIAGEGYVELTGYASGN